MVPYLVPWFKHQNILSTVLLFFFQSILKNLPELRHLNISSCNNITDGAFQLDKDQHSKRKHSVVDITCIMFLLWSSHVNIYVKYRQTKKHNHDCFSEFDSHCSEFGFVFCLITVTYYSKLAHVQKPIIILTIRLLLFWKIDIRNIICLRLPQSFGILRNKFESDMILINF